MIFFSTNGNGPSFRDAGLAHNPFNALIVPRPIGWISTVSTTGIANLAPYSFFNAVSGRPPMVMFAASEPHQEDGEEKDSVRNVRETRQFVVNLVGAAQQMAMNDSSAAAPRNVDEFEAVGLEKLPGHRVAAPRVKGAPAHLECELERIVEIDHGEGHPRTMITIGHVVAIHIDESLISDGKVDISLAKPIGRLGYFEYCRIDETFDILRPTWPLTGG